MGVVGWLAHLSMKQAVLMGLIASLPGLFISYTGFTEDDFANPERLGSAHLLISAGVCLFVAAMAYRALPMDFIPDWIPILGKIDDLFAGLFAGIGLCLIYAGWHFGTGPKPAEILIAADLVQKAKVALYPFQVVAVTSIKAGIKAARPVVNIVLPMIEKSIANTVMPVLLSVKDALLGAAFDSYITDLEQKNPAFSLVKNVVKAKKK